jgi:hypothetical protein
LNKQQKKLSNKPQKGEQKSAGLKTNENEAKASVKDTQR